MYCSHSVLVKRAAVLNCKLRVGLRGTCPMTWSLVRVRESDLSET